MKPDAIRRVRRTLLTICAIATLWTAVVALTGGFAVHVLGVQVSSRNPQNPALLALLSAVIAWALPMPDRGQVLREMRVRWMDRGRRVYAHWPASVNAAAVAAVSGIWLQIGVWAHGRPLWLDEEMIALNVRDRSLSELSGPLWLGQSAPFGWLAVERGVLLTLGQGEAALRLVPLLFGVATLLVALWAGRRWLTPVGAAVFVLLCGVSPWLAHYPLEVKHYSADVFWALLLPVLAVWSSEGHASQIQIRRAYIWWALAAVAQWFSNGGVLVIPACSVFLVLVFWRRLGWRGMLSLTAGGVIWLVSFAVHFAVGVRHTLASSYLRNYWSGGFPPESVSGVGLLKWLALQFQPLAINPGGTGQWLLFWLVVVCGLVVAKRPIGVIFLSLPLTAFVLGALRVVPLAERQALWTVPALYFGIASFADLSVRLARVAYLRKHVAYLVVAIAVAFVAFRLGSDIVGRGWAGVQSRRSAESNHSLDDRSAVRWLMREHQSGDAVITTHLALPALWWYGGIQLSPDGDSGSHHSDGGPLLEAAHMPSNDCRGDELWDALEGHRRVLLYFGFPDYPHGFDQMVIDRLRASGSIQADRRFADASRVAIIALPTSLRTPAVVIAEGRVDSGAPDGCVVLQQAHRW